MSWRAILRTSAFAVPRGLAAFLGLFSLLNVIGELRAPGFDANLWWISMPAVWRYAECGFLGWSGGLLLWFAAHRTLSRLERIVLTVTVGLLLMASIWNVLCFYQVLIAGTIQTRCPIPFSAIVAACLGIVGGGIWRPRSDNEVTTISKAYYALMILTCGACGLIFPVAQMICFGMTDYRRPADVIVVFGAKVYANGRLSSILEERVRTGCELYRSGLASHLVFSGGPGVGQVHETEAMRNRALELGVSTAAITLDREGLDTESTAINTLRLADRNGWKRILAVSQFYHLPRIKLAFHRRGSEVYTVPSVRIYQFRYMPYFMLREVAAWWLYYLRPLYLRA